MKAIASKSPIALLVEDYQAHLIDVAGLQPSTCHKWTFFVRSFLDAQFKPKAPGLQLRQLEPDVLLNFVLRQGKHYPPGQLQSLASALRSFCRFLCVTAPETLALSSQVLAIPLKRFDRRLIQPLSAPEVEAILAATDPTTPGGHRDHLLFNLLYHTGARVSEALKLQHQDIHWEPPSVVSFHGKGRKERTVPLLKPIAKELKHALDQSLKEPSALIFRNRLGQNLTRSGVEKRLNQTVRRAAQQCPSVKARTVSPHTFRHTTAMRLLQADVDIMAIALLLGHASPTTTHHCIELDLQMKERCLRKLQSPKTRALHFKPSDSLLEFLEQL